MGLKCIFPSWYLCHPLKISWDKNLVLFLHKYFLPCPKERTSVPYLKKMCCRAVFCFEINVAFCLKQRLGSISFWRGSGSWDPHLGKMDPDPRIHLSVIVDPDPRIHIWKKWIRIRFQSGVPFFHIFHKEIHVGQIKMLIFITA